MRGKVEYDGLERVSSQTLLDLLEVPQRDRRAGSAWIQIGEDRFNKDEIHRLYDDGEYPLRKRSDG